MIGLLSSIRKLVLGETWTLPVGILSGLGIAALLKVSLPHDVWVHAGGFVLLGLMLAVLALSLRLTD